MPLRPLGLGEIYDASFRIIRFNPRATVGSAVLVSAIAMGIPLLVTAVLSATVDLSLDGGFGGGTSGAVGVVGTFGSLGVGLVLTGFGSLFVTAMVAHVAAAAAVGRRLSLAEAWVATRGSRWRLVALSLLLGLVLVLLVVAWVLVWVAVVALDDRVRDLVVFGLVSTPVVLALLVWAWVRLAYLAIPCLVLERVGVLRAVRRAFVLTRRQFWRTFGIALLTLVLTGIASQVLSTPIGLIGQVASLAVPDRFTLLALVLVQAVSQVVSSAFVTPFTGAVSAVQYLDQRMRKEAYDVELMQQAGVTAA